MKPCPLVTEEHYLFPPWQCKIIETCPNRIPPQDKGQESTAISLLKECYEVLCADFENFNGPMNLTFRVATFIDKNEPPKEKG